MAASDKARNKTLEAEGKGDQVSADVKDAGEQVKDAFKDM